MHTNFPSARHSQITVQDMQDEVLVFDAASEQANLLNQTAALVWQECDGKTSVSEITARVSRKLGAPVNEKVVWYALNQLSDKNLLQERVTATAQGRAMTRREFMRAGLIGAAVVLPVIVTITAPQPAAAASCTASGLGCVTPSQCCSGVCDAGTCQ